MIFVDFYSDSLVNEDNKKNVLLLIPKSMWERATTKKKNLFDRTEQNRLHRFAKDRQTKEFEQFKLIAFCKCCAFFFFAKLDSCAKENIRASCDKTKEEREKKKKHSELFSSDFILSKCLTLRVFWNIIFVCCLIREEMSFFFFYIYCAKFQLSTII